MERASDARSHWLALWCDLSFTVLNLRLPVPFVEGHQTRMEPKEGWQKRNAVTTRATACHQPGHAVRDAGDHEWASRDDTGPEDAGGKRGCRTLRRSAPAADRAGGLGTRH